MQPIATPHLQSVLLACAIAVAFPAVAADAATTTTTTTTSTPTTPSAIGTSSTTEAKLAAEFADFLGGETQAKSVVSALRQGTSFNADAESSAAPTTATSPTSTPSTTTGSTTTGTTAGSTTTGATSTSSSTGTMGYGEVRMTLRLAQAQLNQMGITQPTDAELAAVLQGGEVGGTQVDGILALRADGMGWGQIAQKSGMTVGQLMGKSPVKTTATVTAGAVEADTASGSTTRSASAPQARSNGYIPSSPKAGATQVRSNGYIPSSPKAGPTQVRSNGYIPSGKSNGAGIVSGAGDRTVAASGMNRGQTHKAGTSAQSSAGGASAGARFVSMGGGSRAGASAGNHGHSPKN